MPGDDAMFSKKKRLPGEVKPCLDEFSLPIMFFAKAVDA